MVPSLIAGESSSEHGQDQRRPIRLKQEHHSTKHMCHLQGADGERSGYVLLLCLSQVAIGVDTCYCSLQLVLGKHVENMEKKKLTKAKQNLYLVP